MGGPRCIGSTASSSLSSSSSSSSSSITSSSNQPMFNSYSEVLSYLVNAGYTGIEASLADLGHTHDERLAFSREVHDAGMKLIVGVYSSWCDYNDDARLDLHAPPLVQATRLRNEIIEASDLGATKINAHSGSDGWTEDESACYFEQIENWRCSGDLHLMPGVRLSHETHRGRPLGSPWVTDRLLQRLPELRLTSDYSHWVVSCERNFGHHHHSDECEEKEVMRRVTNSVDHIHARVGTTQSPQIVDIRDRSISNITSIRAFTDHWIMIRNVMLAKGELEMSVTPEYGPMPYTPCHPFTDDQPLSDVWDVTEAAAVHVRDLLEGRINWRMNETI